MPTVTFDKQDYRSLESARLLHIGEHMPSMPPAWTTGRLSRVSSF